MSNIQWRRWLHPSEFASVKSVVGDDPDIEPGDYAALQSFMKPRRRRIPFIVTKGIVEPAEFWKFWIGETNFRLTKLMEEQIAEVEGLERIIFLSRYRFRMGVGNMFSADQVKLDVEKVLRDCHQSRVRGDAAEPEGPEDNPVCDEVIQH